MMEKPLGVGIVGTNWGAIAHMPVWRSMPGVEVRGICTSRRETAEKAARDLAVPRPFWDFREMACDPEIDIFICGTRPPLRYEMTMAALGAGKHVYNNIPFAVTLEQARAMLDLQRSSNLVGAVDAFIQAVPALVRMKELVDEGALGRVANIHISWNLPIWNDPHEAMGLEWFADRINGASGLRNMGAHILHSLVHIFGRVEQAIGCSERFVGEWRYASGKVIKPQVEDTAVALLRLRSGAIVTLSTSWTAAHGQGYVLEAHGDRGRLAARSPNMPQSFSTRLYGSNSGSTAMADNGGETEIEIPDRLKTIPGTNLVADDPNGPFFANASVASDMLRAIRSNGDAAPSFEQAVHVQQVIEAITLSAETRGWVRVADL